MKRSRGRTVVYLGLGSNTGDRAAHIAAAVREISARWPVLKKSALYETSPVGPRQRKFINAVIAVSTSGEPSDALRELKHIERALGRKPASRRWGPRPIDIDILLWGNRVVRHRALAIPHREMIRRRFVLEPLAEIAPRRVHPSERKTMKRLRDELRFRCPEQKVVPL